MTNNKQPNSLSHVYAHTGIYIQRWKKRRRNVSRHERKDQFETQYNNAIAIAAHPRGEEWKAGKIPRKIPAQIDFFSVVQPIKADTVKVRIFEERGRRDSAKRITLSFQKRGVRSKSGRTSNLLRAVPGSLVEQIKSLDLVRAAEPTKGDDENDVNGRSATIPMESQKHQVTKTHDIRNEFQSLRIPSSDERPSKVTQTLMTLKEQTLDKAKAKTLWQEDELLPRDAEYEWTGQIDLPDENECFMSFADMSFDFGTRDNCLQLQTQYRELLYALEIRIQIIQCQLEELKTAGNDALTTARLLYPDSQTNIVLKEKDVYEEVISLALEHFSDLFITQQALKGVRGTVHSIGHQEYIKQAGESLPKVIEEYDNKVYKIFATLNPEAARLAFQ